MTLACEDGNSQLVEVVAVVDIDDEKCVGNSLLQILKLKIKKLNFSYWMGKIVKAKTRRQLIMHKCGKLCKSGNILKVKIERDSYLGYSSFAKLVLFLGLKQNWCF